MLKLISRLVDIACELAFELEYYFKLEYYNNKDCRRRFLSYHKEYAKGEIIHGHFIYSLFSTGCLIKYIRAIALVAHQCCMYKLHRCELDGPRHFRLHNNFPNSFASRFENLYQVEEADEAIIDKMDKLARIVSEYYYIDTINYEQSFITFLIYNFTTLSNFVIL